MVERRFYASAVADVLGVSCSVVREAAHTLGIRTGHRGFTVDQVKEIKKYRDAKNRYSADELKKMLEEE